MLKNNLTTEEEKVEIIEKIIPYSSQISSNYNINNELNLFNQNIILNSPKNLKVLNFPKNPSFNSFENKKENEISINLSRNFKKANNNNFKTLNSLNKIKSRNKAKNLVSLNIDDLYNAFVLFQELISKYENEKLNNIDYIKNKLYEFILMKKNKNFTETIDCIDNLEENENENIFDVQNYLPIYYKSERDNTKNINNTNFNEKNSLNLIKSYSFSYSINNKSKLFNNYFNILDSGKDSIKSNSQIFNEYLFIHNHIREKTLSRENSKSFHHNYSFDIKNKDKNESFHSIHDNEKEKNKDIYLKKEKNELITYSNNINNDENFKSYQKETNHKSPFDNPRYYERVLKKNKRKFSTCEDLKQPLYQNNNNLKKIENNDCEEYYKNKYLSKNNSFKENKVISPIKLNKNFNNYNNSENKKYQYIESQRSKNIKLEIKVNKKKTLNNKEQLIEVKIKELNNEILKFKEERNKVTLLKEEYEKLHSELLKDIKEFNRKKEMQQKFYKLDYDKSKGVSNSEAKLIMSITQHNQSLILNNNKKSETIELLKQRIYELENIIKSKNNYDNSKNYTKINNNIRKKKINENSKINLKKNIGYNSSEKAKRSKHNIVNQTINENILNKNFFDNNINKKFIKTNNKKIMNVSYNSQVIKNSILNSKLINYHSNVNNNFYKKYCNNANINRNLIKKNNILNNNKLNGINITNNSINIPVLNNQKIENPVYYTNLNIYEKLINKQREKQKNFKRMNLNYLNSEKDIFNQKIIIKELKSEVIEKFKNDKEKDKKTDANLNIYDSKNILRKYEKSKRKNKIMNRVDLKSDIYKHRSNRNIIGSFKRKSKNNSKNKKNISAIRPLTRNDSNMIKIEKSKIYEINNSVDNKAVHNNIKKLNNNISINRNISVIDINDENEIDNGYDFVIPEKYKKNSGEIINTIDSEGKKINIYANNKKEIIFKSGVRKEIFVDGYQLVHFPNGDMKQKYIGKDEKVIYYYSETNTVQTSFKNGLNIFKFNNGQIEKHYPDGSKFIIYTNGIKRKINKNGEEKLFVPDKDDKEKNEENIKLDKKENNNNYKVIDNKMKEKEDNDIYKEMISNENELLLSFLEFDKESNK